MPAPGKCWIILKRAIICISREVRRPEPPPGSPGPRPLMAWSTHLSAAKGPPTASIMTAEGHCPNQALWIQPDSPGLRAVTQNLFLNLSGSQWPSVKRSLSHFLPPEGPFQSATKALPALPSPAFLQPHQPLAHRTLRERSTLAVGRTGWSLGLPVSWPPRTGPGALSGLQREALGKAS